MKVAVTNIKLKLHAATQFTLVDHITAYTVWDCDLQRVTGIAILAVYLCLQNSIRPFSDLSFTSLAFSDPAFSALPIAYSLFVFARTIERQLFASHMWAGLSLHVARQKSES